LGRWHAGRIWSRLSGGVGRHRHLVGDGDRPCERGGADDLARRGEDKEPASARLRWFGGIRKLTDGVVDVACHLAEYGISGDVGQEALPGAFQFIAFSAVCRFMEMGG